MRGPSGECGQTTAEYVGLMLIIAAAMALVVASPLGDVVIAKVDCAIEGILADGRGCTAADRGDGARGPDTRQPVGSPPRPSPRTGGAATGNAGPPPRQGVPADTDGDGVPALDDPVPGQGDADRDGLRDAEEVALGSNARSSDTDGDGVPDRTEYEQGTDPARAVAPLTDENRFEPWERVGMSEAQWRELEEAVLEEVNPDGLDGFLNGPTASGVTLDEDGELELMEIQQMSVGGGIARGLSRLLGGGGRALTAGQALSRAASRVPAAVRGPLARLGVLRGAARVPRPPAPPPRPGTALGALDDLGRPIGASATITRGMLGTGTRASPRVRPPGFGGRAARHSRGHLIARQLGGSGDDARNLVTLFQRPANSPVMRGFENQVRAAVEAGQAVRYTVTPIYRGTEAIPRAVTLSARGSRGFRLDVSVLNKGG